MYAGTDIGVYYRDEQLSEWIDYSGNLPNVIVNDLEIDYFRIDAESSHLWQGDLAGP